MKFTTEQLEMIKDMSGHFMSIDEIAVMIGVDPEHLKNEITSSGSHANIAYNRGKAKTKLAVRKRVVQMATYGSPQAESLVEKYIVEQIKSERDG